jgi:hypothetical protein
MDEEVVPKCIKIKQVHGKLIRLTSGKSVEHSLRMHWLWRAKYAWQVALKCRYLRFGPPCRMLTVICQLHDICISFHFDGACKTLYEDIINIYIYIYTVFTRIKDNSAYKMTTLHNLQFSGKYQYSHSSGSYATHCLHI